MGKLTKTVRRYSITVDGFDAAIFDAPSAGAARYRCWRAWREAGYGHGYTFRDFLGCVTTLCLGRLALSEGKEAGTNG